MLFPIQQYTTVDISTFTDSTTRTDTSPRSFPFTTSININSVVPVTTEYPQVVSTDRISYDYVIIPSPDTSRLKLRDLFGLCTERSPDLDGYGLPPPALTTALLDGNCTNSAQPAPVPRRLRRSGPFTSEGDTRDVAAFTRAGS